MLITELGITKSPVFPHGTFIIFVFSLSYKTPSSEEKFKLLGSTDMLVNPSHPKNALSPMLVTESGITMLVNPVHPSNTLSSISVTELGIAMLVNPVQ